MERGEARTQENIAILYEACDNSVNEKFSSPSARTEMVQVEVELLGVHEALATLLGEGLGYCGELGEPQLPPEGYAGLVGREH